MHPLDILLHHCFLFVSNVRMFLLFCVSVSAGCLCKGIHHGQSAEPDLRGAESWSPPFLVYPVIPACPLWPRLLMSLHCMWPLSLPLCAGVLFLPILWGRWPHFSRQFFSGLKKGPCLFITVHFAIWIFTVMLFYARVVSIMVINGNYHLHSRPVLSWLDIVLRCASTS